MMPTDKEHIGKWVMIAAVLMVPIFLAVKIFHTLGRKKRSA